MKNIFQVAEKEHYNELDLLNAPPNEPDLLNAPPVDCRRHRSEKEDLDCFHESEKK